MTRVKKIVQENPFSIVFMSGCIAAGYSITKQLEALEALLKAVTPQKFRRIRADLF